MSCADFCETLEWDLMHLADEQHWDGGSDFNSFFAYIQREAKRLGVTLTDVDTFGYDTYWHNYYRSTEKGLS